MSWWNKIRKNDKGIEPGDYITYRDEFPNLDKYFYKGPLKVIRIDDGPAYAGGSFVICECGNGETGFYLNAVKKSIMSKYRIIKIECGKEVRYRIQKQFICWYFSCGIIENYFRYEGRALLIYRNYDFGSIELAQIVLDKIKNPFKETYNENKIVRVFGDVQAALYIKTLGDIYINKSNKKWWNNNPTYEYSESLEDLKRQIDKRTAKKVITIIN